MTDSAWLVGGIVLFLVGIAPFVADEVGSAFVFTLYAFLGIAFVVVHFTRKSKEAT